MTVTSAGDAGDVAGRVLDPDRDRVGAGRDQAADVVARVPGHACVIGIRHVQSWSVRTSPGRVPHPDQHAGRLGVLVAHVVEEAVTVGAAVTGATTGAEPSGWLRKYGWLTICLNLVIEAG